MLAFNLGVFFKNLKGEEVTLAAKSEHCELYFAGGVAELTEHTDLSHHLAVTLTSGKLICRIVFEEAEEEEEAEDAEVEIQVLQVEKEEEKLLLQTAFRFEEVTLKPVGGDDEPDSGPLSA